MRTSLRRAPVWVGILLMIGCSDAVGPSGQHQLQLQVQVTSAQPTQVALSDVTSLEIEEAVIVFGGLKLETAALDETVDWTLLESVVLPLDITGEPTLAFNVDVPAGTYKELELSIDKLEIGHPQEQALIDVWPQLADASVYIGGTLIRNDTPEPFVFTAALDIDQELDFDSPLHLEGDGIAVTLVTLDVDVGLWFESSGGGILDPYNPSDRSSIEAAIGRSMSSSSFTP